MAAKTAAFSPCILFFSFISVGTRTTLLNGQKTWCVAKPSSAAATLQANINYACGLQHSAEGLPLLFP